MIFLRQSTASQEVPLGRFVSSTDGDTERTALSIANTDIKIWKTGATTLANKNSGGATHISNGEYYCVMDATDSDTIGPMKVSVHVATALSVQVWCTVLDEAVYDALFGTTALSTYAGADTSGTTTLLTRVTAAVALNSDMSSVLSRLPAALTAGGNMKSDALAISGDTTAADNAESFFDGTGYTGANNVIGTVTNLTNAPGTIYSGTAVSADSTSVTLDPGYDPDADPTNMSVFIESDQGSENQLITAWDADTLTFSVAGFNIPHADNIVVTFYPFGAIVATDYAKDTDEATTQAAIATLQSDVTNVKDRLPAALSDDGNLLADVQTVVGTAQTAGDLANLALLIKAKTDPMTFTLANKLDANIKAVADDAIQGSGTSNDQWRPA